MIAMFLLGLVLGLAIGAFAMHVHVERNAKRKRHSELGS